MQTQCINIGNQSVDAIATINSTYIMNSSDPLMAVAIMKGVSVPGYSVELGNKHIHSNFNVLIILNTQHDEDRYEQWLRLINKHIIKSANHSTYIQ